MKKKFLMLQNKDFVYVVSTVEIGYQSGLVDEKSKKEKEYSSVEEIKEDIIFNLDNSKTFSSLNYSFPRLPFLKYKIEYPSYINHSIVRILEIKRVDKSSRSYVCYSESERKVDRKILEMLKDIDNR